MVLEAAQKKHPFYWSFVLRKVGLRPHTLPSHCWWKVYAGLTAMAGAWVRNGRGHGSPKGCIG